MFCGGEWQLLPRITALREGNFAMGHGVIRPLQTVRCEIDGTGLHVGAKRHRCRRIRRSIAREFCTGNVERIRLKTHQRNWRPRADKPINFALPPESFSGLIVQVHRSIDTVQRGRKFALPPPDFLHICWRASIRWLIRLRHRRSRTMARARSHRNRSCDGLRGGRPGRHCRGFAVRGDATCKRRADGRSQKRGEEDFFHDGVPKVEIDEMPGGGLASVPPASAMCRPGRWVKIAQRGRPLGVP